MWEALPHPSDTHSSTFCLNLSQSFGRHSFLLVLNVHMNVAPFHCDPNQRSLATGASRHIRHTPLHKPKYCKLHFWEKSFEVVGNLQVNVQAASLRQSLH